MKDRKKVNDFSLIEEQLIKAKKPVLEMYEKLSERAKKIVNIETTSKSYHDKSGYELQGVHARIRIPEIAKPVLQYINDKYRLNGIEVFGSVGLHQFDSGGYGIHDTETLEPLRKAIEECAGILNRKDYQDLMNEYKRCLNEEVPKKYALKLEDLISPSKTISTVLD